ncbi:MAG: 2-oxoacid:acceptor oxidoreductase family protein [Candidatus Shikimatogenerans sp. JK-2022]|nr:2-oxoacid:acceptor oxidoreductase family protein [Candidatus Shikimatogenerans bostrichidophilus]
MYYLNDINIILSGYSGEGIQHMGYCLSYTLYKNNYYIKTYNNIPSEILSPTKTKNDISEFFIRFNINKIISYYNFKNTILILTNFLSLKKNLKYINKNSILILSFNKKNFLLLKKNDYIYKKIINNKIIKINIKKYININLLLKYNIKKLSLKNYFKNSFLIGILLYILNLSYKFTIKYFKQKFKKKKNIFLLNYYLIKKGIKISKTFNFKYYIKKNKNKKINKKYKIINGNLGIVLGLILSSIKFNKKIFFSSYPITPSISIYKYFKKYSKLFKIIIFNSEDEISSICTSIGASLNYKKYIGITATSGPGMSLLQESLGLAIVLEIPLIIINVQRVGPSTGFPTKLEQSDLMQSIYGRHGEAPLPVFALYNIKNIIKLIYLIFKLSFELMSPIIILSDIFLSNNLSLWKKKINNIFKIKNIKINKKLIYNYNKKKIIGGLITNINNHKKIIIKRQNKINYIIKKYYKYTYKFIGYKNGKILIISWGSNYEIIKETLNILFKKKIYKIGYLHLICLYPIPKKIIEYYSKKFNKIIIFELNNKQLIYIIKSYCKININIISYNKMNGKHLNILKIIKFIKKKY